MNIIIPIGGKGERFKKEGYMCSKPLIKVFNKEMILYVLNCLNYDKQNDMIYIIYYSGAVGGSSELFEKTLREYYDDITFIEILKQTEGASETIMLGLDLIIKSGIKNKNTMILDCDAFYSENIIKIYKNIFTNAVFYMKDTTESPIYSYIKTNEHNEVIEIKEKIKISDNANTGVYCFEDINELFVYSKKVVETKRKQNGEYYISCIIDCMIDDNKIFIAIPLKKEGVFNLGSPEQLQKYIKQTFLFLFDLDGTLIKTEDIYHDIWKDIMKTYEIDLTKEEFNKKITGNNDETVLKQFELSLLDLPMISKKKNEEFNKNIDKIKVIDGVYEFLEKIKYGGHKLALVTNSNKETCDNLLKIKKLKQYFDYIVYGNTCKKAKPYPDPYINAIKYFTDECENKKAIIFEDSKTGFQSAKQTEPLCIVGIETLFSKDEMINKYCDFTLNNYMTADYNNYLKQVLKNTPSILSGRYQSENEILKRHIKSSIKLPIKDVLINVDLLNGGFICDVFDTIIILENDEKLDCVIKLEKKNDTEINTISINLDLFNREYYFYEKISNHLPINIPKFYGIIKNDNNEKIGIIMENLSKKNFVLNLDLNKESITTSLKIIDALVDMHLLFQNLTKEQNFTKLKKNDDEKIVFFWKEFIFLKWNKFKTKWGNTLLTQSQLNKGEYIIKNMIDIQKYLSKGNLTLIHGDVKSKNIFYDKDTPYFIDWQYITLGKGVQDLVFFIIESFDMEHIVKYKSFFKEYYYIKITEHISYSREEYENDFIYASYLFPFQVALWFGTLNDDEIIDKLFPINFIKKLFYFYEL